MQRDLFILIVCGIIAIFLIGLVIVSPPTAWTFFSIVQFVTIVVCGMIPIVCSVALISSGQFRNAIIPENLKYEPIDSDDFLEILLEEGLTTEPAVKMGQNRLSRIEIKQISDIVKRRLKSELRRNLHQIAYNTLLIWFTLFFMLTIIFLLVIVAVYLSVLGII